MSCCAQKYALNKLPVVKECIVVKIVWCLFFLPPFSPIVLLFTYFIKGVSPLALLLPMILMFTSAFACISNCTTSSLLLRIARKRGVVPVSLSVKLTSHSVPLEFSSTSAISALPFHDAILKYSDTIYFYNSLQSKGCNIFVLPLHLLIPSLFIHTSYN